MNTIETPEPPVAAVRLATNATTVEVPAVTPVALTVPATLPKADEGLVLHLNNPRFIHVRHVI